MSRKSGRLNGFIETTRAPSRKSRNMRDNASFTEQEDKQKITVSSRHRTVHINFERTSRTECPIVHKHDVRLPDPLPNSGIVAHIALDEVNLTSVETPQLQSLVILRHLSCPKVRWVLVDLDSVRRATALKGSLNEAVANATAQVNEDGVGPDVRAE